MNESGNTGPAAGGDHNWTIRAGDAGSPVILHVPHASRQIPAGDRKRIVLDDAALAAELDAITDADTDRLAVAGADRAGRQPWIFTNRFSRLLIDPERFPDEREEMAAVGMGAVYLKTTTGATLREPDPDDDRRLMDRWYHPYAQALEQLVTDRLEAAGRVLLIDVHSFPAEPLPYELHSDQARPPLCIGVDDFHTPAALVERIARIWPGETAINEPFAGTYVPLRYYGKDRRVESVMLEIRRDVIAGWMADPAAGAGGVGIATAVAAVIDTAA